MKIAFPHRRKTNILIVVFFLFRFVFRVYVVPSRENVIRFSISKILFPDYCKMFASFGSRDLFPLAQLRCYSVSLGGRVST